jgi:hypothetical protein
MVVFIFISLHTGILSNAPADVLIASSVTKTEPILGMTNACTPAQTADLAMAPKFLTSVI